MNIRTLIIQIIFAILTYTNSFAENHCWQVQEFTFSSETALENPYVESLQEGQGAYAKAVFTNDQYGSMTVPLFWDGGKKWTVRFAPPSAGSWSYAIVSDDDLLNGKSGSFDCVAWTENELQENPTRRGFIQVNQTTPPKGRFFQYADGTPFLWIGDTWWNWSKGNIHLESFKKLADDRSEKGFTVGQLFFAGRGWGKEASILNQDYTMPDLEHLRLIESFVRYANEKGITVWIHAWWGSNQIDRTIGGENLRRWWRYVVDRLQAYNVIWVLAGEYNLYDNGGFELEFWNELGRMIKDEDAYNRITSAHPTPPGWDGGKDNPQWSTADVLHNQDWLDYNQSQVGHGKWRNEMIPSVVAEAYQAQPAKPIVVTEPWYEFVKGNPAAVDIRFGAWSAMLSGAAGHSYAGGHVWKAHVPESRQYKDTWPMDLSFEENTLDYPGARSMSFMSKFLAMTKWWIFEPHPEFVKDNPSKFCAAKPGEEYIIFLRYGGSAQIDLRDGKESDKFSTEWIDLTEEKVKKEQVVNGGAFRELHPPEGYPGVEHDKDWIIHIKKMD